ncbi:MAG TPA: Ig-like domain-containing protein, partial [Gemmatimonadaceae bacterium]
MSFAPSFSVASAAVYDGLGAFGLTVDNIHIHIDHPPAPPFDTVVAVPPGSDSLLLNLPVQLAAPTEQLNVLIELRDGSQVLFSGTQTVTATIGVTPSGPAPSIPIVYIGPGAGATQLSIAPRDTAVAPNGVLPFRFVAKDANNATLTGVTVAWTTSGAALGTIDANGVFTAGATQGVTRIVASTLNGLRDSTTVTVTAPASKLVVVSGGGQTGVVGAPLSQPFIVQAQTATGTPVPGVSILFSAPASGSVGPASAVTDVSGNAQTTMTLGHTAGAQSFGATSGALADVSASESATAGAASTVAKVSGDAQADSIGSVLPAPLVVKVTDAFSNPVANATVDWVRIAGDGTLAAASSQTTTDGLASIGYTLSRTIRTDSITATLHGVPTASVQFTATSLAKQPSSITRVSGDGQTAVVSSVLANPFVVKVADDSGRPVVGAQVTWAIVGGGGTVSPVTTAADTTGTAQAVLTLGNAAGTNTVSASVSPTLSISFTATATAAVPATITRVAGDSQVVVAGAALPVKPSVRVADAHGNAIVGATVTFAVTAGGGAVTGASQTTNASGVATVGGWTVGPSGAQALTATTGSLSVAFTALISGPPGAIGSTQVTSHLDTLTALGDTYTLIAQARDTLGALAVGTFTWVSRTPATATVNSSGVVTGVANGSTWVVATEAGGTRDSTQIVVQQRVATVLVTPGARNVYLTRTYALSAQAVDGRGNPLAGTPTFTWTTNAPAVATVSSAGLVTGVGLGSAQISATTGTIVGVSQISILTPITRIVVGRDSASLPVTDTTSLKSLGVTRT